MLYSYVGRLRFTYEKTGILALAPDGDIYLIG